MNHKIVNKFKELSENNKSIIINIFGAFSVKGLSLLLSLFTMPAYLRYFNDQVALGLWFTILSVLTWILNFDLGVGNGLRNFLTKALAENNYIKAKIYISSAYLSIGVIVIAVILVFSSIYNYINWNNVFNIKENVVSLDALNKTVIIVFIGIMMQFFLKLISSVLYAMQKSSINNLISLCTSILIFLYVSFAPSGNNDTNMITMAIIHSLAVAIPLLVATLIVFNTSLKKSKPSLNFFDFKYAKNVLGLGGIFFFVQIMYMVIMSTNEYLITIFSVNENVVEYQVYYKLFTIGGTIFTLALTPIWSMVTKAIAEKNFNWVKKLYKKLLIFAGLGCLFEFSLIPFLQIFVNIWLKDKAIEVNFSYGVVFALMSSLMIINSALSSIANGAGELKTQAIFFGIGAVIKIPMAFILVDLLNSWIGVVIANTIAMSLYCIIQPFWLRKYLNAMKEKINNCVQK